MKPQFKPIITQKTLLKKQEMVLCDDIRKIVIFLTLDVGVVVGNSIVAVLFKLIVQRFK